MKIKNKIYNALINPFFLVSAILFFLYSIVQFFFLQNFFSSNSTDLHYFFKAIPYAGAFLFPVLTISQKPLFYEPKSDLKLLIELWLVQFLQYLVILIPLISVPLCVSLFGSVDSGTVFTSFLMLILYGSCLISLCILIQLLIPSHAISFIVSAVIILVLNILHIFSIYSSNKFYNFLIKIFSFSWHFDAAGKGIFDSRDFFYYAGCTVLFILLSNLCIQIKKGKNYSQKEKITLILVSIIFIFGFADSSKLYLRKDLSKNQRNTVSKYSKNLLTSLESPLKITYYRSSSLTHLYPQVRDIADYLKEYCSEKNVIFTLEDADKKDNATLLQNYGIYSHQLQSYGNNKTELISVFSAIVLEYQESWQVIPFILSSDSLEYDLTTRLLKLITDKNRIVNILCGNNLTVEKDYNYLVPWLNNQGFVCNIIDLFSDKEITEQFDKTSNLLLILGNSQLQTKHCKQIEELILAGVNVFAQVSQYSSDIEQTWNITKNQNNDFITLLENYGFYFTENLAADLSCARIVMESNQNEAGAYIDSTYTQNINYPLWINLMPQKNIPNGITLFWPVALESTNEKVKPVLFTSNYAWTLEPDKYSPDSLFTTNPFHTEQIQTKNTERKVLKVGLELNGELNSYYSEQKRNNARILVIPDQYFINSLMLGYIGGQYGDYRNLDYTVNSLLRLNGESELAELQEKSGYTQANTMYKISSEDSFKNARITTLIINFIFIPCLIIAIFIVLQILRKKHIKELCRE